MQARRIAFILSLAVALLGGPLPDTVHDHQHAHAQQALPEVSYICPMPGDEDVNEGKPGRCPKCGMDLIPSRIAEAYTCLVHTQQAMTDKPGLCPLDRRELMPVYVDMYWTCEDQPNERLMDPGKCANGRERRIVRQLRAHGDHNPRHGGQFYMAADKWHHLEGTLPAANLFRLFLYDNFTQPMAVKGVAGRVVTREDPSGKELAAVELKPARDGRTLEAQLSGIALPAKLVAKIKFDAKTPEQRFDFAFTELSKEPPAPPPSATTTQARPATPASPGAVPAPAPSNTRAAVAPKPTPESAGPPATTPAPAAPRPAPAPAPTTPAAAVAPAAPTPAPSAQPPATTPGADANAAAPAAGVSLPDAPVVPPSPDMIVHDCKPNMSRTDALLLADNLPRNAPELVKLLNMCAEEIGTLIKEGQFGYVYQPTILSKDVALALENHVTELPNRQRATATNATKRLVIAAWELDYYGDLGNREKLTEVFDKYAAAAAELRVAYGVQ